MGDRGNIKIQKDGDCFKADIYLYTHWGGSELKRTLAAALDRGRSRWSDGSYLARIIFSEMIQGDVMGETGFGISTQPPDNEYPFLVVNIFDGVVFQESDPRKGFSYCKVKDSKDTCPVSFEEFIKQNKV